MSNQGGAGNNRHRHGSVGDDVLFNGIQSGQQHPVMLHPFDNNGFNTFTNINTSNLVNDTEEEAKVDYSSVSRKSLGKLKDEGVEEEQPFYFFSLPPVPLPSADEYYSMVEDNEEEEEEEETERLEDNDYLGDDEGDFKFAEASDYDNQWPSYYERRPARRFWMVNNRRRWNTKQQQQQKRLHDKYSSSAASRFDSRCLRHWVITFLWTVIVTGLMCFMALLLLIFATVVMKRYSTLLLSSSSSSSPSFKAMDPVNETAELTMASTSLGLLNLHPAGAPDALPAAPAAQLSFAAPITSDVTNGTSQVESTAEARALEHAAATNGPSIRNNSTLTESIVVTEEEEEGGSKKCTEEEEQEQRANNHSRTTVINFSIESFNVTVPLIPSNTAPVATSPSAPVDGSSSQKKATTASGKVKDWTDDEDLLATLCCGDYSPDSEDVERSQSPNTALSFFWLVLSEGEPAETFRTKRTSSETKNTESNDTENDEHVFHHKVVVVNGTIRHPNSSGSSSTLEVVETAADLEGPSVRRSLTAGTTSSSITSLCPADLVEAGKACEGDKQCVTGVCVACTCQANKLQAGEECDSQSDCESGACGKRNATNAAPKSTTVFGGGQHHHHHPHVCCPNGTHAIQLLDENKTSTTAVADKASGVFCTGHGPGETCWDDRMCENGVCGVELYQGGSNLVCCATGVAVELPVPALWAPHASAGVTTTASFCTGQLAGQACGQYDQLCASGVCVAGNCLDHKVSDGDVCDSNTDCVSGACGRSDFTATSEYVCCASGESLALSRLPWRPTEPDSFDVFCTAHAAGDKCGHTFMCADKKICGRESYQRNADYICCPSGKGITLSDLPWEQHSYIRDTFCIAATASLSSGDTTLCRQDILHQTGACVAAESNLSSDTLAAGESKKGTGTCTSNADCPSGGACGKKDFAKDSNMVCCQSGATITLSHLPWEKSPHTTNVFCTGHAPGDLCWDNAMCSNQVCAREFFEQGSPYICCNSGESMDLYELPWEEMSYLTDSFCAHQALGGQPCGVDRLCKSNICVAGFCKDKKLADGKLCDSNFDCEKDACGKKDYTAAADYVCCESGQVMEVFHLPWAEHTYMSDYFCTGHGAGDLCAKHAMCASGVCAKESYTKEAKMVCCEEVDDGAPAAIQLAHLPWEKSPHVIHPFCTQQATGKPCGRDDLCKSGHCVSGICKDGEL